MQLPRFEENQFAFATSLTFFPMLPFCLLLHLNTNCCVLFSNGVPRKYYPSLGYLTLSLFSCSGRLWFPVKGHQDADGMPELAAVILSSS